MARRPPLIALGVFTMAVLALEVFLTRLLAYTVNTFLIYLVLGIAMTGFGAAGSLVALRRRWLLPERVSRVMACWAIAFPITVVFCYATFVRLAPSLTLGAGLITFVAASLLTIPFVAAGAVITIALSSAGSHVGYTYAADLVGSGIGCFIPLLLLGPLTGERFIAFLCVLGALAALGFVRHAARDGRVKNLAIAATVGAVLSVVTLACAPWLFHARPENLGQVRIIERYARHKGFSVQKVFDRWNMTGRVEVYSFHDVPSASEPYDFRFYAQDNTAGAVMARWDGRTRAAMPPGPTAGVVANMCSDSLFGQAYFRPRRQVLVIGVGGGADVQCALYHGAEHVDAVEINPDAIKAITGPFNTWLGNIGNNERVSYHIRDGRSFARAARREAYDLIELSGVDTKNVLVSGALALSENHLYTREAFVDYLRSLRPGGVLSLIRFGEEQALRLVNTAAVALRVLGIQHPEQHIVVARNGLAYGVIVRKAPYPADELAAFHERLWFADRPFVGFRAVFLEPFAYVTELRPELVYQPGDARDAATARLLQQIAAGSTKRFEAGYSFDISPTTDDRPFFFDVIRRDTPEGRAAPHLRLLRQMVISVLVLALGLIVLPLVSLRAGAGRTPLLLTPVYFAAVGLGYLFVEIWLIHRFAMFLGHQSYALSVVLATLLVATGLGAACAPRLFRAPRARAMLGVLGAFVLIGLGVTALSPVMDSLWQSALVVRALTTMAFVAPVGFFMGFPFPAGLEWLRSRHAAALPWGIGINFFASVLATTAALPLALAHGYFIVLAAGVIAYAVALAAAVLFGASQS